MNFKPSECIDKIYARIIKAKYLTGISARLRAHEIYLDEVAGIPLSENDPLIIAEKAILKK